jgi:hypothetical protein
MIARRAAPRASGGPARGAGVRDGRTRLKVLGLALGDALWIAMQDWSKFGCRYVSEL